jgi:circadian clock protein KaiC
MGRVRRAASVIKKRSGPHEDTIREYRIGKSGITIGEPLEDFHGVLRGVPTYRGRQEPLLPDDGGDVLNGVSIRATGHD